MKDRDYALGLEYVKEATIIGIPDDVIVTDDRKFLRNSDAKNRFTRRLLSRYDNEIMAEESYLFGDILTAIVYLNRQIILLTSENKSLTKKIESYDKIIADQTKKIEDLTTDTEDCIKHIEVLEQNLRCLRETAVRGDKEIKMVLEGNVKEFSN